MKKLIFTATGSFLIRAILSLIAGMALEKPRSLLLRLVPEETILKLANDMDSSKEKSQFLIDEQNTKLEEQWHIIQEQQDKIDEQSQSISNLSGRTKQVDATTKETQAALNSYIDCANKYNKYPYCKQDRYRKKSAFNKMVQDNKKDQSKEAHESDKKELEERYAKCQTFIDKCPI